MDNCRIDPTCRTRRIVHRGSGATDYIIVPGNGNPATDASPAATGNPGATGSSTGGGPTGAAAASGASCEPHPAQVSPPSFDQTALPTGDIHVNPHHHQLTGLESWYWWTGPPTHTWQPPTTPGIDTDCARIDPPHTDPYTARLVALEWHVEDSAPGRYHATGPGSETHPSARHTYRTKGRWTTTVTCVWQGDWGDTATAPCGQRDLDVVEIRARLGNH